MSTGLTNSIVEHSGGTCESTVARAAEIRAVRADWFGIFCSFGCAIHCAATPIIVAILPSLTTSRWLSDPLFHQGVAVLCGVLVVRAILPGFRMHHDRRVIALASSGLVLLFIAAFILPHVCFGHSHVGSDSIAGTCVFESANAWSRPLFLSSDLQKHYGSVVAQILLMAQPYLSPLGGLLLIAAHVLNIRLRCCSRGGC